MYADVISETYEDMATRYGKFVDFNDPTQVWRRLGKKRLRISRSYLYCQKL